MGEETGAKSVDLEWVHVHPMGLAKPDDADAKMKFLAAEALRGVGGIILNAEGKRFCNELGRRDYVTGEMWKSKPPFRLCLNKAAFDEINWHCKRYTGRGAFPPSLRFVRAEDSEHQLQQLDLNDFPMLRPLGRTCRASDQALFDGDGQRARAVMAATVLANEMTVVDATNHVDLPEMNFDRFGVTMLLTVFVDLQWAINLLVILIAFGFVWNWWKSSTMTTQTTQPRTRQRQRPHPLPPGNHQRVRPLRAQQDYECQRAPGPSQGQQRHKFKPQACGQTLRLGTLKTMVHERDSSIEVLTHYNVELQAEIRGMSERFKETKDELNNLRRDFEETNQRLEQAQRQNFNRGTLREQPTRATVGIQGPCTYTRWNSHPRFTPMRESEWGAWTVR
ncbi:osm1 [Symbiodinium necroappetens]|uniref:Osm1 protein n=1 Tax=Symbiodinium necroappetens TaxID=1628268 RepID=A0A813A630_9DINO|nr:osm1 [Symbiodinium necroappetens]